MAQRLDVRYVRYCTEGSNARKLAPVQPFKTLKLPRLHPGKQRIVRVDPVATAGILMAVIMLVLMIVGMVNLADARQDAARMESYAQTLKVKNEELRLAYESKCSLQDVQETATALGLIPMEQATHITLELPEEPARQDPGALDRFFTFLTGLFA